MLRSTARLQTETTQAIGKAEIEAQTTTAQKQIEATAANTRSQIRATVGIAYQQKILDELRLHTSHVVAVVHDMATAHQRGSAEPELIATVRAMKQELMQIALLLPQNPPKQFLEQATALMEFVNSQPAGVKWSEELDSKFNDAYKQLVTAGLDVVNKEVNAMSLDS